MKHRDILHAVHIIERYYFTMCVPSFGTKMSFALLWRHNEHDGVSNHQPHDCLLNRWPVNSQHKRLVVRKMFPFDDVSMERYLLLHFISCKIQLLNKSRLHIDVWGLQSLHAALLIYCTLNRTGIYLESNVTDEQFFWHIFSIFNSSIPIDQCVYH